MALMVRENPNIAITRLRLYASTCRLISVLTLDNLRVRTHFRLSGREGPRGRYQSQAADRYSTRGQVSAKAVHHFQLKSINC
jgi:hypothetical protein